MKIVIPITSSARQLSGVQRHGINLARCLLSRKEITAVHLICASWQQECLRCVEPICDARLHVHTVQPGNTSLGRNIWYYVKLPRIVAELGTNIVHLAYPMPVWRTEYHCPTVVTLHDLYPYDAPGNFGFPKVLLNEMILHQCLRSVDAVSCVSQSTRDRLWVLDAQMAKKAVVISNCVEPQSRVSAGSPVPGWAGEPFLLCVAQHRPNKNLLLLLRIFRQLLLKKWLHPRTRLVIVGMQGPHTRAIRNYLAFNRLQKQVVLMAGLSDEELQWCYRNCDLLIAPSLVEGFGLPVAEALVAGCRVVCSDIPAFREVGGDWCKYVPLNADVERAFVETIRAALRLPKTRPVLLPQLSAIQIAEQYLQLYKALLSPVPSPGTLSLEPTISASGGTTLL
jgi:glycosyltransferase involved in cell wall biosynthesis